VSVPNPWFSWQYVVDHRDELLAAGREHVALTVVAVLAAVVVAVPLALLARRVRITRSPILLAAGVLYTIPALALMTGLWPVLGLSPRTVEVALAAYALLIVLRNILTGLDEVPADVVEAARGMGFGPLRLLLRVELPLALPAILAGVRVATVSTIGLVTVGALFGYGGFGSLIYEGFQNNFFHAQIMTATLACVLLAVVADVALLTVQRAVTPWQRSRGRRAAT
jgi:osmoprotectant transport system permease protein